MTVWVNQTQLASHLFCETPIIAKYLDQGVIERRKDGKYNLDECRKRVLRHLRELAAGRRGVRKPGGLDGIEEKAKLTKEQAEHTALKTAILRGEYVKLSVVLSVLRLRYSTIRELLLSIPGKIADGLAGKPKPRKDIEALLRREINEALTGLSKPKAIDYVKPLELEDDDEALD